GANEQNCSGPGPPVSLFAYVTVPLSRRIAIKAAAGFAAQPAGGDVFLEEWAGAIFGIAEAFEQDIQYVHADVEPDEVGEFERAHRMVHAQLHHRHGIHEVHADETLWTLG